MPKIIEWVGAREGDIIWRYPVEEINWGDNLIVHEYEAAIFFRDGKSYDVFRAGRHVLTTANLPLLTSVLSRITGFDKTPFRATVIFISLKQFQGRFGGQGQTRELAPLKFHGSFWFRVEEPNLFVNEVVGGQGTYTTERLQDFLRGYFLEKLIDSLSQYSLIDVYGKLDETSFLIKNLLYDAFRRIGLDLIDVKFEGLDTSPDWRDRIFFLKTGISAEELLRMQTVQKAAESLSKSEGAAVGAGIAIIPPLFQAPQPQPQILCPKCGRQNPQNSRFCNNCGSPLMETGGLRCPNCGVQNIAGAKFCSNCGSRLEVELKCRSCGSELTPSAKFCPNCGTKLT
ncbi:MAG: SPFH domain-containing protein [Aigarchaeota archaeon]|nr:SPFH domain-containing protein [Aigarchaeota archaeon]MDW7985862.1 SPFH domain-containing protein [Nitrososphaerota archaeon]